MLSLNQRISLIRNDLAKLKINSDDFSGGIIEYTVLTISNLDEKVYTLSGSVDSLITYALSLSGSVDNVISNVANLQRDKQNTIISTTDLSVNDLRVLGNLTVDGSFNINNIIQNDITINEILISTQVDISNEGTGRH
jgi:tRNA/tmRNA/rRNA uracil-C5-methylase (TrmA/RlmC/RlmD family)